KHKDGVGMKIPSWMITDEMKLTDHYRMYAVVFGRSTRLTPPTPIPTTVKANDIILQDTIQLSLAEQKGRDELEAQQNVQKVKEHLIAEKIENVVEGAKNVEKVEVNSSTFRQDETQIILDTRLEPKSDKESLELKRREKGKHVEEFRSTPSPTTIISPRTHSTLISSDTEKLQELTKTDPKPSSSTPSSFSSKSNITVTNRLLSLFKPKPRHFKRYRSFFDELQGRYGYLFEHLKTRFMPRKKFNVLAQHLQEIMKESLPTMTFCRSPKSQDDPHDDAHPEWENSAKRQKTFEHGTFVFGESSYGQDFESEQGPSKSGNQEQLDDFDFWTDSYVTDDDKIPNEKVSQEIVDEISHTVDESKLRKVLDEIRKEIIVTPPHPQRPTPVVQSCQRDPKAPALSLVNQDLLYLKKGSSRPEKIVMSLHKFPTVIFPDDDIEEITSRWVENLHQEYSDLGKSHDFQLGVESYQQKVNLTTSTITFPEIHKFYDATLKRVLEGLKSYNNDVKHGYITPSLSKEDAEYLHLFEEEIEERLKHRDQMR
ncbi:hypothetical protein Tco_0051625, partial [Tanacetum coccineum]